MLNVFGFEVIGAYVKQLPMLDLSREPDCSCKFKYIPLAVHFSVSQLFVRRLGLGMVYFRALGLGCSCSAVIGS